jgi:hypothetical protein
MPGSAAVALDRDQRSHSSAVRTRAELASLAHALWIRCLARREGRCRNLAGKSRAMRKKPPLAGRLLGGVRGRCRAMPCATTHSNYCTATVTLDCVEAPDTVTLTGCAPDAALCGITALI